jgi:hypothetical protein
MTDREKLAKIEELQHEKGLDRQDLELLKKLLKLRIDFKKQIGIMPIPVELREKRLGEGEPLVRREEIVIDIREFVRHWRDVEKVFLGQGLLANATPNPEQVFQEYIDGRAGLLDLIKAHGETGEILHYVLLEVLKPIYETHAEAYRQQLDDTTWVQPYCYVCGGSPDMAMLLGDGGKRFLCCGLCDTSWWYAKLKCPHCGNEDLEKLVSLALSNESSYVIHGCKACNRYTKVVDGRMCDGAPFMELEDLLTSHLDVVARNEGFRPY